jgi:hypothetical protein
MARHTPQRENDRGVIGRLWLRSWSLINLTGLQTVNELRRQEEMIDAYSPVVFERLTEIIPERELTRFSRMQTTERVGVSKLQQSAIACSRLRLEQRIADP